MKKFVAENLNEYNQISEERKSGNAKNTNATKNEKIDLAISALEKQLEEAKKPGKMKDTTIQKNAKIKELQDKIKAWKEKRK